jgi:hypothetical protein
MDFVAPVNYMQAALFSLELSTLQVNAETYVDLKITPDQQAISLTLTK